MLSVIALSFITSSVIMPSVITPSIIMPSVIMPSVIMPSVIMPSVIMPSVIMSSVVSAESHIFWYAECLYVDCHGTLFKPGPAVRNNNAKGCYVLNQEKCIFIQNCLDYLTVGTYTMIIFERTKTFCAVI